MSEIEWFDWRRFPDPRKKGILVAPFGPGVYELRHRSTGQLILYGSGGNCASQMSSLLPKPLGCGHRSNSGKRQHVLTNLSEVDYRTVACENVAEAKRIEAALRTRRADYLFQT